MNASLPPMIPLDLPSRPADGEDEARRRGLDGVVCGHIHKAEIRMVDGMLYCNDGDWVESLTALVEDDDGTLRLVEWSAIRAEAAPPAPMLPAQPLPAAVAP